MDTGHGLTELAGSVSALVYGRHEPDREEVTLARQMYLSRRQAMKPWQKPGVLLARVLEDIKAGILSLPGKIRGRRGRTARKK